MLTVISGIVVNKCMAQCLLSLFYEGPCRCDNAMMLYVYIYCKLLWWWFGRETELGQLMVVVVAEIQFFRVLRQILVNN